MPQEYPYQTWQRLFGKSWPSFAELQDLYNQRGIRAAPGSYEGNIALQQAVLGGWDPYKPAAAPAAPAPPPPPIDQMPYAGPTSLPPTPSVPMQIEPGAYFALQEEILELQRQEQVARDAREKERLRIERERLEQVARETELRLSTSPIDFVAYEEYKREREAAGKKTYTGPASSDIDIRNMVASLYGGEITSPRTGTDRSISLMTPDPDVLGIGAFGAGIPRTQAISRAESLTYSPDEMDILGSFLKAGFQAGGKQVSYDPVDYWREVEEGFVPTIQAPASTKYTF